MNSILQRSINAVKRFIRKPIYYGSYPEWHFNMDFMPRPAPLTIGNYTSIAKNTTFIFTTHRPDFVSTHAFGYAPESKGFKKNPGCLPVKPIEIGNDVWIGANVTILPGVKIGNGAVIGAGSVVYRNVKPYSVVAGNPAVFVYMRFDKRTIKNITDTEWWNWPPEVLKLHTDSLTKKPC